MWHGINDLDDAILLCIGLSGLLYGFVMIMWDTKK